MVTRKSSGRFQHTSNDCDSGSIPDVCVMWNAERQMRLSNTAAPARTVERGTQRQLNPSDSDKRAVFSGR